ncbi:hypothetical protein [Arthrobacter sp. B0490]|uniref:hypothetical protein n=1 Tax=Arthrobacter sp. B0490 TaxID=2058891 RepID=UPI0011B0649E|nr:hypothetical protein [Arthrobacter sp. B0490]
MQDYSEFVRAMRAALTWCGTLRVDQEGATEQVWLLTPDGREFLFRVPLAGIFDAVTALDSDIMSDPDDGRPIIGQLGLFAVHVQEAVDTAGGGERVLEFTRYGVDAQ